MKVYKCIVCDWEGVEDDLVLLPGYLWDYTEHEACPKCWKENVVDNRLLVEEEINESI